MSETIGAYVGKHYGKPAVILGGGSTLQDDLAQTPAGAVRFAVNMHAHIAGVLADYAVFCDNPGRAFYSELPPREITPRISHHGAPWSDIHLTPAVPDFGFTSGVATWVAQLMGCDPVIVCGMGCYQDRAYCHDLAQHPRASELHAAIGCQVGRLRGALAAWERVRDAAWRPDRLFAVSGPLAGGVLKAWPGGEVEGAAA